MTSVITRLVLELSLWEVLGSRTVREQFPTVAT